MQLFPSTTKSRFLILYTALVLLVLGSCAKNEIINETPRVTIPESQELVHTTLYGRIIDESGASVEGAQISYLSGLNPGQTLSDIDGYFKFLDVDNKGRAAFFSVRFPGKFEGFRKYSVLPERFNYTEVKLLERRIIGSVNSEMGGKLSTAQGASVDLPKGGIVDGDGKKYNGDVNVAMAWIDPSAPDLSQRMVGDLSGMDEEGNYRSLSSYGMLQVELMDGSGNILNIQKDESAVLEFPIPESMIADATPVIPLWSYDEVIGTWIQEGVAIFEGNTYVANVGHFSSWNVDHMTDPIEILGQVKWKVGEGSVGGSYFQVYVCSENIGRKGGWLCDDGSFRFYNFPKDESFKIKIFDKCESEIFRESYGPYSEDTDIGIIEVVTNENVVKVFGNAINCDGAPVTNGQVNISHKDRVATFPIDDTGQFEFSIDFCNDEAVEMQIVDLDAFLANTIEIKPVNNVVEIKDFKVCEELSQFISYTIDEEPLVLLSPNIYYFQSEFQDSTGVLPVIKIMYEGENDSTKVERFELIYHIVEGSPVTVEVYNLEFSTRQYKYFSFDDSLSVTLTKNGKMVGEDVAGSFTGNVKKKDWSTGNEQTIVKITGNFKTQVQ